MCRIVLENKVHKKAYDDEEDCLFTITNKHGVKVYVYEKAH